MKQFKILSISVLAIVLMTTVARSQGTFFVRNWAITTSGILDVPVFDGEGNRLSGANYVATLYGGATQDSLAPALYEFNNQPMSPTSFTFVSPIAGQGGYFSEAATVYIPFTVDGLTAWLQVRAWDIRLGSSYEEVVALGLGGYGESNIFLQPGGNPAVPTTPGFLTGLQSFSLLPVIPEPSGAALFLLGALALVAVRRWSGK